MPRKDCAGVLVIKDNKILLNKRNFAPAKGKFDFVGGFVEAGESLEATATREAKEETGYDVKIIKKITALDVWERQAKCIHIFLADIVGGQLNKSCEGQPIWLDIKNISQDILAFPHTYAILKEFIKIK